MKIYEFKYKTGETDWVFASDKKEAISFYLNHTGCGDVDGYNIKPIPESEWDSNYILDVNEYYDEEDIPEGKEDEYAGGYKIEMTFKEYAEKNSIADIICTTEF